MKYDINDNDLYHDYDYLEKIIDITLTLEQVKNPVFSIIFVNQEEIRDLNKQYRKKDSVTDVISFAFEDNYKLNNEIRVLGDIYICIPKMIKQAREYQHSEKRELSFLTVHGLLHLLGYDHLEKKEEKIMFSKQEMILYEAGI